MYTFTRFFDGFHEKYTNLENVSTKLGMFTKRVHANKGGNATKRETEV